MENRYLFRGKRLDNGEWVTGYYVGPMGCVGKRYAGSYIYFASGPRIEVYPATVGQCTGYKCYKDPYCERGEEGKQLLFEADIISFSTFDFNDHDTQHIGVVYWDNGVYWIDCTKVEGEEGVYGLYAVILGDDCVEIIGNKHDNPELLENAK